MTSVVTEGLYLGLLDAAPDAMILVEEGGQIVFVNASAEAMFGYARAELVGAPLATLVPERLRAAHDVDLAGYFAAPRTRAMAEGAALVARHRDGREIPVEVALSPARGGDRPLVIAAIRDVTERRRVLDELARSQRQLAAATSLASLGYWELDVATDRRTYSPEMLALLGRDAAHVDSPAFYDDLHPDDRAVVAAASQRARADGTGYRLELRLRRGDGAWRWIETAVEARRGPDGRVTHLLGIAKDITERRRALDDAVEARANLEAVLGAAPDFIVLVDRDGMIRFINKTLPDLSHDQVVGRSWRDFMPPDQQARLAVAIDHALAAGETTTLEVTGAGVAGPRTAYHTHVGPVRRGGEVVGAVLLSRDVTERKETEAQLIAADRMAAVGALSAGVAHEINNPLAAVVAGLDLALRHLADPASHSMSTIRAEVRDARAAAWRIRDIVRDLRVFSRAEDEERGPVELREVLESTLRMARNEIRHRARLHTDYQPVPPVIATESRLGQVFLNLVINAAQALPEGHADAHEIRVATRLDDDGRVVVEIADTGSGMTAETIDRMFTPFFTTKPAGQGTGLGLAICQRIVTGLGGEITVTSEVGKGSVFRVHLPAAEAPAPPAVAARSR
ncbi:MAG: PAS domain S-box protein, partial [Myxococcales bacterium]|nr:PAS domain S-box protein [Myxococcales bacterium]